MSEPTHRLATHIRPTAYRIDIDASPRRKTFSGKLTVEAVAHRGCGSFEMHARDLAVSGVRLTAGRKRFSCRVSSRPERQTVVIAVDRPLPRGRLTISLEFRGRLSRSMHGLYLARDGSHRAVVSQCEATDARAIFPCFDEPAFKATFAWTVRTDPGLAVIANGALASKRKSGQRVVWRFHPTRKMSSYLAAVTIGHFDANAERNVAGVPCRVVCGPGKTNLTGFAEDVTARVLPWYRDYFGKPYPFAKLDQVAVPGFDAGAMENVGAVFYRQSLLLSQPGSASWLVQKRIAEVIAHEIAHMWFGNLVTMEWWDDLWLNEAFATWVATKAIDSWRPEWRMWDDWLESRQAALASDALANTHPIATEVHSPAEAIELFDLITYEKGCAVLRMIESYLGAPTFCAGIRAYMKRFAWRNATRRDLWVQLGAVSAEPVADLMESWVGQPGFPLVSVDSHTGGGLTLRLSQRRFFAGPAEMRKSPPSRWRIPIVVRYRDDRGVQEIRSILDEPQAEVIVPASGAVRWWYANAGAAGFYRCAHDRAGLGALLAHGLAELTPAERSTLLSDQWALVRCGESHIERFMDLLAAFQDERDYVVVRAVTGHLSTVDNHLVAEGERPRLAALVRWLLGERLVELGWGSTGERADAESPEEGVLRAAVVHSLGCEGRDPEVLRRAESLAALERENPAAVPPDLAGVVVALSARQGGVERVEEMSATFLRRQRQGAPPEIQARYLAALGRFEVAAAVSRVVELCRNGTVPQEQLRTVLVPLLRSRQSGELTWELLKTHWEEIAPRVGAMGISSLVEACGALPVDLRGDVSAFFIAHPVEGAHRAVHKALEALALRQELVERESPRLSRWLRSQAYLD